jgi:hypothetical protein
MEGTKPSDNTQSSFKSCRGWQIEDINSYLADVIHFIQLLASLHQPKPYSKMLGLSSAICLINFSVSLKNVCTTLCSSRFCEDTLPRTRFYTAADSFSSVER